MAYKNWIMYAIVTMVNCFDWQVEVLVGKDKGKVGMINSIIKERNWVYVEGLNCVSAPAVVTLNPATRPNMRT